LLVLATFAPAALSQGLARTTPRAAGLSPDRLGEITTLMQEHVDDEELAGVVAVVARRGKVAYLKSVGKQDIEADIDMNSETIFRIASMTKPITSVAVMILYDDGLIRLDDPVSKYIPEFADVTVLAPEKQSQSNLTRGFHLATGRMPGQPRCPCRSCYKLESRAGSCHR
jgi:CubicO group peptidase (beta-lactamase class C family)